MPDDIDFLYIGGGVSALTFVATAIGGAVAATIPATSQAGDLGVFFAFGSGVGSTPGAPSGWTAIAVTSGSDAVGVISYRVLTGADVGASLPSGISGAAIQSTKLAIFRPDDEIDTVVAGSPNGFAGLTDPPDQTVLASGLATPLLVLGANGTTTAGSADMTSSPAFGGMVGTPGVDRSILGWKIYNANPADHTIFATSGAGSKTLQSISIRVS